MSDFNPFAPRHVGSALSVGGLAALMIAGPLRPDIIALSSACLLGSLTAFATHACFGGRKRRPAKSGNAARVARATPVRPEWEDAEAWEIPPTRDARQAWDAARALETNAGAVPRTAPIKGLHPAMLMQVVRVEDSGQPAVTPEPSRLVHRQALADLRGRRDAGGR